MHRTRIGAWKPDSTDICRDDPCSDGIDRTTLFVGSRSHAKGKIVR